MCAFAASEPLDRVKHVSPHAPNGVLGVTASVVRQIVAIRSIPRTLGPTTTSWGDLKKNVILFSSICILDRSGETRFANLLYNKCI